MQDFKKPLSGSVQLGEFKLKLPEIKLPDPHEAARLAGMKDADLEKLEEEEEERAKEEEQKEEKTEEEVQQAAEARAEARRRRRCICFCGASECRIGPFTKVVDE
jgi:hypothetical protein